MGKALEWVITKSYVDMQALSDEKCLPIIMKSVNFLLLYGRHQELVQTLASNTAIHRRMQTVEAVKEIWIVFKI